MERRLNAEVAMDLEAHDLIVIGAGIYGIAAARFYLEVHPHSKVMILEQDSCPGGTWNSQRSYPGFFTQWYHGAAEFSDMTMAPPPLEDQYFGFFRAKYTTRYLEKYVDFHDFQGKTLRDRICFNFKVSKLSKDGSIWVLLGSHQASTEQRFLTYKLTVASGLTSVPNIPSINGDSCFERPIIHQVAFGQSSVLSSTSVRSVAILGGGKSAADMVYACVKAGKKVSWIIRRSGTGPGYMFLPSGVGPYKNSFELGSARFVNTLSPSIFHPRSLWTTFLHSTGFGNKVVDLIWNNFEKNNLNAANFDKRQASSSNFAQLKPQSPFFWMNVTGGLLNRSDFWDTIAPNIEFHNEDIDHLDGGVICLKGGRQVEADALLLGTGWSSSFTFFNQQQLAALGLPHLQTYDDKQVAQRWRELEAEVDEDIVTQFPKLKNPPDHHHNTLNTTPFRLYRCIAPLDDNSIAFVGFMELSNGFRGAECQAIWATAYLDNIIQLPPQSQREADIAKVNVYCRRRYLSSGERGTFFPFESTLVTDQLLEDVGLQTHRSGWFNDFFAPRMAKDLRGLRDEYIAKYKVKYDNTTRSAD